MIGLASLRWVLTVAFVLTSGYHLVRGLRPGDRISEALHLTMGVSMIVMIWPWGRGVPVPLWAAVFTASTGWFVARSFSATGRRRVPLIFASSMAAMVWMGVSMPAQASNTASDMAGSDMAGSDMAGMSMPAGSVGVTGWISGLVGGYLVAVAFWWFARGLRLGPGDPRPLSWSSLCHGLMSIGMGLALLAMA